MCAHVCTHVFFWGGAYTFDLGISGAPKGTSKSLESPIAGRLLVQLQEDSDSASVPVAKSPGLPTAPELKTLPWHLVTGFTDLFTGQ